MNTHPMDDQFMGWMIDELRSLLNACEGGSIPRNQKLCRAVVKELRRQEALTGREDK